MIELQIRVEDVLRHPEEVSEALKRFKDVERAYEKERFEKASELLREFFGR